MFCHRCPMQETLWVCLTCGFVGCGRYSGKHAAEHFDETNHPYSLELATLRIWDYVESEYAHRPDLLECPSSPPLLHPFRNVAAPMRSSMASLTNDGDYASVPTSMPVADVVHQARATTQLHSAFEKETPKKASMIGEEYEALLQSALEDQAQHYDGEITRLRATLAAERIDVSQMIDEEKLEMEGLQRDVCALRSKIDAVSREVLAAQAQEAGHRANSQRLLREQQVVQDLISKVSVATAMEQEQGRRQIDDLEQQIADLTTNQRMRRQFSQDEELLHAQVFGTHTTDATATSNQKKPGKKTRRMFRK